MRPAGRSLPSMAKAEALSGLIQGALHLVLFRRKPFLSIKTLAIVLSLAGGPNGFKALGLLQKSGYATTRTIPLPHYIWPCIGNR